MIIRSLQASTPPCSACTAKPPSQPKGRRPALPTPNAALARRLQGAAVEIAEPKDQALIQELVDFITTRPVWVEGRLFEGAFVLFLKASDQYRSENAEEFSAFKAQWWPKNVRAVAPALLAGDQFEK